MALRVDQSERYNSEHTEEEALAINAFITLDLGLTGRPLILERLIQ